MLRFTFPLLAFVLFASVTVPLAPTPQPTPINVSTSGRLIAGSPMLEPRSGHTATLLLNGKVLIAGGMRRNQDFYKSAELFDPTTGKFQPTGNMHQAKVGPAAALLKSGKVLIVGGWVGHAVTDSAELYDPATGEFFVISKMLAKRGRPSATTLPNGDVLIAGGADSDAPFGIASAEIFRASDSTFHPLPPMHAGRISHTATLLRDGNVLLVGGRGASVNASAEIFDPATNTFKLTGALSTARYKHSAGILPDGRILIAGGSDDHDWQGNLASAEIYNPQTQKFSAASPLNDPRFKLPDEAATLPAGKLLFAGGAKTLEIYDPSTAKFVIATGEISAPRHYMTETKLPNGTVLLTGGYPNNDQATAETWLFIP